MAELVVGIQHIRDGIEASTALNADMSVIGVIGTAPDADETVFPLNTPVHLFTNDITKRSKLGGGTLEDALVGISAQLAASSAAASVVIVRVQKGADDNATIANIVGSEADATGIWAFLDAPELLGVTARLLIAPGHTHQQMAGPNVVITNAGSGLTEVPTVAFTGGGSGSGKVLPTAHAVLGTGANADKVVSIVIDKPGANLSGSVNVTFSGGGAAEDKVMPAATATIEIMANAVCANIVTVAERTRARFLPEGPTGSPEQALTWLETLPRSAHILHPLRQVAKIVDADGSIVEKPLSPYVIALYARRDAEAGGVPAFSIANQQLYGISGVAPRIPFSITDASNQGQLDISRGFGIIFRGEVGVDGSLTDGGYTFWGTDTLSAESAWQFAHVNRLRDFLELYQVKTIRGYLGKYNITLALVQAVVNTIESKLRDMSNRDYLLGYKIYFTPADNSTSQLRLGFLNITFQAEEPPVFRKLTLRSRRYEAALESLVASIAVAIGSDGTITSQ
ncbi:phage tail protein [Brucella sp.]|uniref:phage tail protein n=1 Tax=Brucella sp. TaxID=52132 RepID=UPI0028AD58B7|nr:phage tail protein [Brucella sp.]